MTRKSVSTRPEDHVIPLDGVLNLRELGGYPLPGGGETRLKRLLRSDDLKDLTPGGQRFLIDHGLRTVIDLRNPEELEAGPDPFAQAAEVRYLHLPFFDDSGAQLNAPDVPINAGYLLWLERYPENIRAIFKAIAAADHGTTLFHCVAGKDRTGLVAGILLALAGLPDDVIGDDYAASYPLLKIEAGDSPLHPHHSGTDSEAHLARRKGRMREVLDGLRSRYGGAAEYLREVGVSEGEIAALAARLVE